MPRAEPRWGLKECSGERGGYGWGGGVGVGAVLVRQWRDWENAACQAFSRPANARSGCEIGGADPWITTGANASQNESYANRSGEPITLRLHGTNTVY